MRCGPRSRAQVVLKEQQLKARQRKRFRSTTMSDHDLPEPANLLDRQLTARNQIIDAPSTPPSF
jgi:hypothetical protein